MVPFSEVTSMPCSNCGSENPGDWKFYSECVLVLGLPTHSDRKLKVPSPRSR
jgi:hypothetical protein